MFLWMQVSYSFYVTPNTPKTPKTLLGGTRRVHGDPKTADETCKALSVSMPPQDLYDYFGVIGEAIFAPAAVSWQAVSRCPSVTPALSALPTVAPIAPLVVGQGVQRLQWPNNCDQLQYLLE